MYTVGETKIMNRWILVKDKGLVVEGLFTQLFLNIKTCLNKKKKLDIFLTEYTVCISTLTESF